MIGLRIGLRLIQLGVVSSSFLSITGGPIIVRHSQVPHYHRSKYVSTAERNLSFDCRTRTSHTLCQLKQLISNTAIMGYGKDDELAINTIRLLAVSGSSSILRSC